MAAYLNSAGQTQLQVDSGPHEGGLPFTGMDAGLLCCVGLCLLLIGLVGKRRLVA
jgi:hypothetical protein